MKRFVVLALMAMVTMVAGQAWAGVANSIHDMTIVNAALASFGVCSACHIPHKAVGNRLWPSPIGGTNAARGDVGNLCTYCHDPNLGVVPTARTPYPFKDTAPMTHGLTKANAPEGTGNLDATLPYIPAAAGAIMQCTSCHNVHDQSLAGRNAFLQDDIDVLCARCHPFRQFVNNAVSATQGTWGNYFGYDPAGAAGNPGSHPVGTDIFGDGSQHDYNGVPGNDPDSPINTTAIQITAYGAQGDYNLGPKLIDGGTTWQLGNGIGCVTCHMVHGRDQAGPIQEWPTEDVLVEAQNAMSGHANGNGDPANYLCEDCHRGVPAAGYAGTLFPNPGGSGYTHPVDNYYLLADAGVTALPAGWPSGDGVGNPGGPDIICESCHMPHPLAAMNNSQTDPYAATNSHILRDIDTQICDRCHTGTVSCHHPVGAGMMDGTRFRDDLIGDADANMDCADCHNGSGAHNWLVAGGVGLDPSWEPFDNGRPSDTEGTRFVANTSKECIDCHTNASGHFSPTRPNVAGEYQDAGEASHFIGQTDLSGWAHGGAAVNPDGNQGGTGGNFVSDPWDSTGWSRFGGAAANTALFVCESCHELEPDKNACNNALLLAQYQEGIATQSRSLLCEGCHSPQGTATGSPHPMTADTITRAVTAGRGTTTLVTGAGTYADQGARGDTTYPAADQMNCDSCHQPHDAVNASGTYILESTAGVLAEITGTPADAQTVYGYSWANMRYNPTQPANKLNYQNFCNLCHSSGI